MKNIDILIQRKIAEIVFCVLFIVVTTCVWYHNAHSESIEIMKNLAIPSSYAYVDAHYNETPMFPISDETALTRLVPSSVSMVNDTLSKTKYSFGLRVSKKSTLDYHYLKISFHEEVSFLKDFYQKEDDEYYYFLFETGILKGETKEYQFKMWIDYDTQNDAQNKNFIYEFVNLENI